MTNKENKDIVKAYVQITIAPDDKSREPIWFPVQAETKEILFRKIIINAVATAANFLWNTTEETNKMQENIEGVSKSLHWLGK